VRVCPCAAGLFRNGATEIKNHHSDIHNLYDLLWNRSIWEGYIAHKGTTNDLGMTNSRPFILSRSAAAGIQRYGVAMWSGDIPSRLEALATHANAHGRRRLPPGDDARQR